MHPFRCRSSLKGGFRGVLGGVQVRKLLTSTTSEKDTRLGLGLATHSASGSRLFQLLRALLWARGRDPGLPLAYREPLPGPSVEGETCNDCGCMEPKSRPVLLSACPAPSSGQLEARRVMGPDRLPVSRPQVLLWLLGW